MVAEGISIDPGDVVIYFNSLMSAKTSFSGCNDIYVVFFVVICCSEWPRTFTQFLNSLTLSGFGFPTERLKYVTCICGASLQARQNTLFLMQSGNWLFVI